MFPFVLLTKPIRFAFFSICKIEGRFPVKSIKIVLFVTMACFMASDLIADIYEWTDDEGVKHYTNYAPPPEATILMKTQEVPYDEAADRARMEAEREEQLELARLELAERKAELEWREAQTEQRLAEAGRQAEETLREAEKILDEARNERYDNRNYRYSNYYRGDYPYHYKSRYYYRNETGSIHYIRRPHPDHFKHYRYKKYQFSQDKKHHRHHYYGKKHPFKSTHRRDIRLRSHKPAHRGQFANRSSNRSHAGRVGTVFRSRRN
jgi:hypothetical protein